MEISSRSFYLVNRLLRNPIGLTRRFKTVNSRAVKEEVNSELLNSLNQDIQAGGAVPVFRRALLFPTRIALQDDVGIYTYAGLHQAATALSKEVAAQLLGESQRTVTYMCSNDASHVITQWAIWMTGNIAVPLTPLHPPEMLKYFITDSDASVVVCTQDFEKILAPITKELSKPLLVIGKDREIAAQLYQPNTSFLKKPEEADVLPDVGKTNAWYGQADAMLIYTSGTTSKPKGVVWTHNMLGSQISSLQSAWQYSANDVVLHTLPLHHIHGQLNSLNASLAAGARPLMLEAAVSQRGSTLAKDVVLHTLPLHHIHGQLNSLNASLAAGARIRMLPQFASHAVWARLLGMGEREDAKVTVFHGVPAMYARLAADHAKMFNTARTADYVRNTLSRTIRLMCAGSAPLPETLLNKWEEITGIRLLERYGMSEAGMALSNPYRPVEARTPSCVGGPLPGVAARLATATDDVIEPIVTAECELITTQISLEKLGILPKDGTETSDWQKPTVTVHKENKEGVYQGELLLKGPGVFSRYWNRSPKLDQSDFTTDGWFRTGDTAQYSDGKFRILGRTSVDIIKTSGYKVSALQVESALLEHPSIEDAAVLGIEDEDYGEIVTAVVVLKGKDKLTLPDLKQAAGKKLAPYQLPRNLLIVDKMPRNAMGKLDKKEIRKLYGDQLKLKK